MFEFRIQEIYPHVYHLHFDSAYDLAMHFLRVQEYYESPKYHKKIFSIADYMEWYAKEHGDGAFTYPKDWSGFNVPSWALREVRKAEIPDPNRYDRFMFSLVDWAEARESGQNYYFIGSSTAGHQGDEDEESVLDHEVAHAFYSTSASYRREASDLVAHWQLSWGGSHKSGELASARAVLRGMGYHYTTIQDEIHAYCATGLIKELEGVISEAEMVPFQKLFQEFKRKCTIEQSK